MIDGAGTNHFVTLVMFMNYLLEIKAPHKLPVTCHPACILRLKHDHFSSKL